MQFKLGQEIIDVIRQKNKSCKESLSKKYTLPQNTYKTLVATCGFGHSGSGVIIDLLSEFDNTTVHGGHDKDGGSPLSKDKTVPCFELDFIRRPGGVFYLENICREAVSFYKEMYILSFINLVEYYFQSYVPIYNDKFLELSYNFVNKLTDKKIKLSDPLAGNEAFRYIRAPRKDYKNLSSPFLAGPRDNRYRYYIKDLTVKEYRNLAKEYINEFLNTIESKEYLVIDAILADTSADFNKYQDYIENYKQITVYRDPRDVYVTGKLLELTWIPRDKEDFVFWFRNNYNIDKYLNANDPRQLVLRFEDLVLDYDNSVSKVLEFLNMDKSHHIAPKTQFRPEYSIKNIGLYEKEEDQETIKYIYEHLKEYCYEREKRD